MSGRHRRGFRERSRSLSTALVGKRRILLAGAAFDPSTELKPLAVPIPLPAMVHNYPDLEEVRRVKVLGKLERNLLLVAPSSNEEDALFNDAAHSARLDAVCDPLIVTAIDGFLMPFDDGLLLTGDEADARNTTAGGSGVARRGVSYKDALGAIVASPDGTLSLQQSLITMLRGKEF